MSHVDDFIKQHNLDGIIPVKRLKAKKALLYALYTTQDPKTIKNILEKLQMKYPHDNF